MARKVHKKKAADKKPEDSMEEQNEETVDNNVEVEKNGKPDENTEEKTKKSKKNADEEEKTEKAKEDADEDEKTEKAKKDDDEDEKTEKAKKDDDEEEKNNVSPTDGDAEENDAKPTDENGEKSKDDDKKKNKRGRKKKVEKKSKEDVEGSSDEEELPPGTLDGPVKILTTKRERMSTDKFKTGDKDKKPKDDEEEPDFSQGKGVKLKDIPYIKYMISMADSEDLMVLHKLMYRKRVNVLKVKKNVRDFCGYPFGEDSKYFKAAHVLSDRLVLPGLRFINGILGLEKGKDREKMRTDLMDFLNKPKDLEIPLPEKATITPREKSNRKVPIRNKSRRGAVRKGYVEVSSGSDDDEEDDEEEQEKEEETSKSARKSTSKNSKHGKIVIKTKRGRGKTSKRKSISSDSSDDEPLIKRKRAMPSDAELKKYITSILKDADLEEVTMKNIVRQVYDEYSNCDLSSRKEYIKSTVKDIL